ncbi:MAG: hypothetical protein ABIH25_01270 [Candidatus Woesearchaeota archaeon]
MDTKNSLLEDKEIGALSTSDGILIALLDIRDLLHKLTLANEKI